MEAMLIFVCSFAASKYLVHPIVKRQVKRKKTEYISLFSHLDNEDANCIYHRVIMKIKYIKGVRTVSGTS